MSPTKFIKFSLKLLDYMCFISQKKCKTLDVCLKNQSDDWWMLFPRFLKITKISNTSIFGLIALCVSARACACEVNLTPHTVYLIAAVAEMRDEGRVDDSAERVWPRCEWSKHGSESRSAAVTVPLHSGHFSEMRLSNWHLRTDETRNLRYKRKTPPEM